MYCRAAMAVMDANMNCDRQQDQTTEGNLKFRIMVK